jgi:hypothetical protein
MGWFLQFSQLIPPVIAFCTGEARQRFWDRQFWCFKNEFLCTGYKLVTSSSIWILWILKCSNDCSASPAFAWRHQDTVLVKGSPGMSLKSRTVDGTELSSGWLSFFSALWWVYPLTNINILSSSNDPWVPASNSSWTIRWPAPIAGAGFPNSALFNEVQYASSVDAQSVFFDLIYLSLFQSDFRLSPGRQGIETEASARLILKEKNLKCILKVEKTRTEN